MATYGTMQGNSVTVGGNGGNYFFINWSLDSQSIANNTSTISWNAYFHFNSADSQLDNGYADLGGSRRWTNGGRVKNFDGNYTTRNHHITGGSFTIGHNSDGTKTLSVGGQTAAYQVGTSSGSASWSLPTIPRHGNITATSGNINDDTNPWIEFTNPASGSTKVWLELPNLTGTTKYAERTSGVTSRYTWTLSSEERDAIRSAMASVNSTTLRYKYANYVGGSWVERSSDSTMSIVSASPIFSNFDYADTNATTVAITGNDQYIIQNKSTLRATVALADKAEPLKQSTMSSYHMSIFDKSEVKAWSDVADVYHDFGTINAAVNQTLTVKAVDSRNNQTIVNETVTMIPYAPPVVSANGVRLNNFEATTTFTISGSMSLLQVGGVTKNAVSDTDGVQYRYKDSSSSTWGDWVAVASTTDAEGKISTTSFDLTLDNTKAYNFEVKITDVLDTTVKSFNVSAGKAIFRIGSEDGKIYNNELQVMPAIDEDDMASDSAERVPTQQSVKAYINNNSFPITMLQCTFNNGTTSRSVAPTDEAAIPGIQGDTSYTAPCDVDIHFNMSHMANPGTGNLRIWLTVNGVKQGGSLYYDADGKWNIQAMSVTVPVDEGETITIGTLWKTSVSGQGQITNDSNDYLDFQNIITGVAIPRGTNIPGIKGDKGDTGDASTVPGPQGDPGTEYPWEGSWQTSTLYAVNDCVNYEGSGYVCLVEHTSGTFSTDLASGNWSLLVQAGTDGLIGSNAAIVQNETPDGLINGSNTDYTIASGSHVSGSLIVYSDGIRLSPGVDFTETATGFTMTTAPAVDTVLLCDYLIDGPGSPIGSNSNVYGEVPTGLVNGTNKVFTASRAYIPGSLKVYINGSNQARTTHFVETDPSAGTFTMDEAPLSSPTADNILIDYQFVESTIGNSDTVDGYHASATPTPSNLLPLDSSGLFPASVIGGAWQDWNPTVGMTGGAVTFAKYIQIGKTVHFRFKYTYTGAAGGTWTITAPVTGAFSTMHDSLHTSTKFVISSSYLGMSRFEPDGNTIVSYVMNTSGTYATVTAPSATIPATWANNSVFSISGTYEAA